MGQREALRVPLLSLECGNGGDPVHSREIVMVGERYYTSKSRVLGQKVYVILILINCPLEMVHQCL